VVLLAYDPAFYRWRDSGVYREALMLGAPVLVTAGTWMAREVEERGNGLVIEDLSAAAIADCICRAQRELPALRAAAARVADDLSRTQGVANYISTVLDAFRH
jgi:glycosyltransferase involved in cell wall biosynthesis